MKALILLFTLALFSLPRIHAQQLEYCLGRFDVAGMPLSSPPATGSFLQLSEQDQALNRPDGTTVGYVPSVYQVPLARMLSRGVVLRFELVFLYPEPAPGRHLQVVVWAEPPSPSDLEPLIYRIARSEEPAPEPW